MIPPLVRAHPAWCDGGHACGLGEHRSEPRVLDVAGGRAVLTRVRGRAGGEWAEVTIRVPLSGWEPRARWQLGELLRALREVLRRPR